MKKAENIIIGSCIIVAIILMVFVIITMINYQPITSNNLSSSSIPYASVEDIEITLSPEKIVIENYNQTISLRVDMKNIAQSDRMIDEQRYTYPTGTVKCYFSTNVTSYVRYLFDEDVTLNLFSTGRILRPNETFTSQIDLDLGEVHDYRNRYLYEENPDSCQLYISLVFQLEDGQSNTIEIERL